MYVGTGLQRATRATKVMLVITTSAAIASLVALVMAGISGHDTEHAAELTILAIITMVLAMITAALSDGVYHTEVQMRSDAEEGIKILMRLDALNREEAEQLLDEYRDVVDDGEDPEEVLYH